MENRVTGNEKKRSKSKIVVIILLAVVLIAAIVGTQTPIVSNAIESKKVAAAESRCEQVIANVFNKLNVQGAESFNFDYAIFRDVENGYSDVEVYGNHDGNKHRVVSKISGKLAESYYDQLVVAESGKRSDYLKVLQTCLENLEQKKIEKTLFNIEVSSFTEEQAKNFVNFFDTEDRNVVAVMPTYFEHMTFSMLENGNCAAEFTLKVFEVIENESGTNISLGKASHYFAKSENMNTKCSVVESEYKIKMDKCTTDLKFVTLRDKTDNRSIMINKILQGDFDGMYLEKVSENKLTSTTKTVLNNTGYIEFNN